MAREAVLIGLLWFFGIVAMLSGALLVGGMLVAGLRVDPLIVLLVFATSWAICVAAIRGLVR
jgi:hypothetical protein